MCLPLLDKCTCTPLAPRFGLQLKFTRYFDGSVGTDSGYGGGLCFNLYFSCTKILDRVWEACFPCFRFSLAECCCCCCMDDVPNYAVDTISLEMTVNFQSGLRSVNNLIGAIIFYHPSKNTNFGEGWNPSDP